MEIPLYPKQINWAQYGKKVREFQPADPIVIPRLIEDVASVMLAGYISGRVKKIVPDEVFEDIQLEIVLLGRNLVRRTVVEGGMSTAEKAAYLIQSNTELDGLLSRLFRTQNKVYLQRRHADTEEILKKLVYNPGEAIREVYATYKKGMLAKKKAPKFINSPFLDGSVGKRIITS